MRFGTTEAFEFISGAPRCGHTRTDLTDKDVRFWAVKTYVIIYRESEDRVIIEAVTQGSRDIPIFLSNRNDWSIFCITVNFLADAMLAFS